MGTKVILVVYQHLFGRFCTFCLLMKKVQWVQFQSTPTYQDQKGSNTNKINETLQCFIYFLFLILLRKGYTKECLDQKENQREELETKRPFP